MTRVIPCDLHDSETRSEHQNEASGISAAGPIIPPGDAESGPPIFRTLRGHDFLSRVRSLLSD